MKHSTLSFSTAAFINNSLHRIFIFLALIMFSFTLQSQSFHVTKNGDDDNSGSENSPWESIQHAMDNATSGSTVFIHSGIYKEALYVNVSGSTNNYITFTAYENDEVIIDAEGQTSTAIIEVYNVHHIAIENLILRNHQRNDAVAILVEGASDHIRIKGCEIHDIHFSSNANDAVNSNTNAHAIAAYGDDSSHSIDGLEILDNEIHDCRLGYSEALVVNGNVENFKIINNKVYDVTNIGIDIIGHEGTCDNPNLDQARNGLIAQNETYNCLSPYATSAGIYVDGGKDLIIERNRVYNNQWGIEIGCENIGKTTDNIIVRNNLVYGNSTAGLAIGGYDYPSGSGKVTNVNVANNTFYGNDTENDYTGELYISYTENLDLFNNIIYGTSSTAYLLSTEDLTQSINLNLSHNNWLTSLGAGQEEFYFNGEDYQGISEFASSTGIAENSLSTNPNFIALGTNPNLRLTSTSPMINAGRSDSVIGDVDFAGNDRVTNSQVDMGAYEFDPALSTSIESIHSINIFPNPTHDYLQIDNGAEIDFKIYNANGQIILDSSTLNNLQKIDVSTFENGIYMINFNSNFSISFLKI